MEEIYKGIKETGTNHYTWVYDMNLLKEPIVFVTVLKILILSIQVPVLLLLILALFEGNLQSDIGKIFMVELVLLGIVFLLSVVGYYLIYMPIHGVRYLILYEMDAYKIRFIESGKHQKRNQIFNYIGIAAGFMIGDMTVVGASLLANARRQMTTEYKDILKIIIYKRRYIKLISKDMTRNLICYEAGDQEFIVNFIKGRALMAKIIEK